MPGDRVLIEVITAANMAGVEQAKAGFLGLTSGALAAAAGITVLAMAGQSAIEITEAHEKAEGLLSQAFTQSGNDVAYARKELDSFIQSNRSFISSQSDAIESFAKLTRAGLTEDKVMRDINIALDLSKLKHISLTEATDLVTKAEEGRFRGLIGLGIQTKHITNDMGDQVKGAEAVNEIMGELAAKTDGARNSDTQMSQATNRLHNDWEDLATKAGPPLITVLADLLELADDVAQGFERISNNSDKIGGLYAGFEAAAKGARDLLGPVGALGDALGALPAPGSGWQGVVNWANPIPHAGGGSVSAGVPYMVGEQGPELRVFNSPGAIIPHNQSLAASDDVLTALRRIEQAVLVTAPQAATLADFANATSAASYQRSRGVVGA